MEYIYQIIGSFFYNIYKFIPDYGVTIIILTIFIKTLLLPVAIKQQQAMIDMQKIQPHLEELRKKYKDNPQKLNEESMKLYAEHKVNPLGGCLPAFVQLPIFIALYGVITQPLKYILKFNQESINSIHYTLGYLTNAKVTSIRTQLQMIEKSKEIVGHLSPSNITQELVVKIQSLPNFNLLMKSLNDFKVHSINDVAVAIHNASSISMDFLNVINLSQTPSFTNISIVIIIPFIAALTTYISSKMTTKMTQSNSPSTDTSMMNSMNTMMPIMTLFFTFSVPAGLGLYWIVSNIYQMIQQYFLNKYIPREAVDNK